MNQWKPIVRNILICLGWYSIKTKNPLDIDMNSFAMDHSDAYDNDLRSIYNSKITNKQIMSF